MAILSAPYQGRAACAQCGFCEGFGCEMQAKSSTPQELAAYDRAELERWRAVVQASGYVPE